ncbi:MAG: 3'(2'),5'-bisphosphate nucleotidase CysQ [Bacteroidales bacterium]|nr:3'(2'),5'-bisphosphate nucleotidase CysQ [Bacteroidales bacterium]
MKQINNNNLFLRLAIEASIEAGKKIIEIYETDFNVDYKSDQSPLTLADQEANNIICRYIEKTGIPILSEEGKHLPFDIRKNWKQLWIVDPLDGTKEFVKKNGEFTVNIALVENNQPILGVIFCPVLKILYFADQTIGGAYRVELNDDWTKKKHDIDEIMELGVKLPQKSENKNIVVAASRSHLSEETKDFITEVEEKYGKIEYISKGSSLKLCMIAEGKADIYPRFAPTSEWDTAAGQAIVENAGGEVLIHTTNEPVSYNKENILNPWFIAIAKNAKKIIEL